MSFFRFFTKRRRLIFVWRIKNEENIQHGAAYVFGIVFVAWGVVLMEKADFGVSMVVAPASPVSHSPNPFPLS